MSVGGHNLNPPESGSYQYLQRLIRLWAGLTDPGPSYQDPDERLRAILLTTILVISLFFPVLVGVVLMPIFSGVPGFLNSPNFYPWLSMVFISIPLIVLIKVGKFKLAAAITSMVFIVRPLVAIFNDTLHVPHVIGTLSVGGVILSGFLFPMISRSIIAEAVHC